MNTPMRQLSALAATAVGAILAAEPVLAAESGELEEIVVTARKRDEALQSVPVTVDAFTEQTIQSAGIESPRDFVAMVPNMTLVEVQNVGNSFITIRGISQARNSEPSVAVLVDGVLETNPYEFDQELADILNFMMFDLGGASTPKSAKPYSAAEVKQLRENSTLRTGLRARRQAVVTALVKSCGADPEIAKPEPGY